MQCGQGAEVGGAGGVVGGVDAEVEVDGKEEVQLQRVELREGDAADLRPAREEELSLSVNLSRIGNLRSDETRSLPAGVEDGHVLEVFGGCHHGNQQQPLQGVRSQHHSRIDGFQSLQIHDCHHEAA